ncbi:serine hydrolase [Armatimonas sp.]|uniref:serine hydrolase n=1 Tax=Armatimonas sp. TaxID=1872638 RepID=UPI00286C2974|nr:serine hydrolase [Armatimonas sp.]
MKRQLQLQQLPRGLSQLKIDRHVIDPPHVRGIQMEIVDERKEKIFKANLPLKTFVKKPKLDEAAFCTAIHTILKDHTTGYLLHLRKNGNLTHNLVWQWAQTPADKNDSWTESTRMHVASVSKFLTAIGMVKALDSKNVSYDTPIIGYLPDYWTKGNKINQITFRHLLTHKSGFSTGGSDSSYTFMKSRVAMGVSSVGSSSDYENMNFGLCRILMPIVLGDMPKNANFMPSNTNINDQAWDAVSLQHYTNYMQDKVFEPAGVNNAGFEPIPGKNNALAYDFPHGSKKGWNSGDLGSMAGGAAWRLSIKELLDVMNHARRKNTILPSGKFQYLIDNYFGIDQQINTPAGKLYNKNGGWGSGGRKEQCVAYVLPDNMELAVFVNSPIGTEDYSLRGLVKDAFVGCLSE